MKIISIILIVVGITTLLYTGINYTTEEKVVDLGPLKIEKEKKHSINWPPITGLVLVLIGVGVLIADKRQNK